VVGGGVAGVCHPAMSGGRPGAAIAPEAALSSRPQGPAVPSAMDPSTPRRGRATAGSTVRSARSSSPSATSSAASPARPPRARSSSFRRGPTATFDTCACRRPVRLGAARRDAPGRWSCRRTAAASGWPGCRCGRRARRHTRAPDGCPLITATRRSSVARTRGHDIRSLPAVGTTAHRPSPRSPPTPSLHPPPFTPPSAPAPAPPSPSVSPSPARRSAPAPIPRPSRPGGRDAPPSGGRARGTPPA